MEKSIRINIIYNFAYQILIIILPLVTTPYVARVLGPEKLGEYSYYYSISYYFVMLILLGINNYGNRTIALVKDDQDMLIEYFNEIYFMQLMMGIFSVGLYIFYCIFFSSNIISWILILYIISAILDINWFFFGMELFKLTVIRNTIIKISTTILIFLFVKKQKDIYLYAFILTVGILISQVILWAFLKKYVKLKKVKFKNIIKHFKPNLILFVPILAVSLYKVMDRIMLGILTTKLEVGLYESSERIIQVPMALIQSLGTVMLPKMSNLFARKEEKYFEKYFYNSIVFVMILSSSLCFGIMGVAKYFVPLYYGNGYEKCVELFKILLPSCIFLAFANVIRTQFLIPRKKNSIFIISVILGAIINIIINVVLIPKISSIGAAIGTLVAEIIVCVYQSFMIRKEIKIYKYTIEAIIYIIPAIIMYIVIINTNYTFNLLHNLFLLIIEGIFVYLIALFNVIIIKDVLKGENNMREFLYKYCPVIAMKCSQLKRKYIIFLHKKYTTKKMKEYISKKYKIIMGYNMNWNNPQSYTQKIQYSKIYNKDMRRTIYSDKIAVRNYVKNTIGEKYLIPIYGIWDNARKIDFKNLPNEFILKTNHGSATNIIVKDKNNINYCEIISKMNRFQKEDFAYYGFELHYANIRPLIYAEKLLKFDENGIEDYKFLCFDGKIECFWIDFDRNTNHKRNVYDLNWNLLSWNQWNYGNYKGKVKIPDNFSEMVKIVETLSKDFDHVRVDLYNVKGKIYFGELTFTNGGGFEKLEPIEQDFILGKKWNLKIGSDNYVKI